MTGRIKEDLDNDRNQRNTGDKHSEEVIWEKTSKQFPRIPETIQIVRVLKF